jgi:hypothetical protein
MVQKNGVNNFDFICVSGYGKSGSGACVDLLKEFEYIGGIDKEFRIVKDPCGLLDLELSIVDNWEFVRHNTAINDFLEYCSMLSRKDGVLKKVGKNFNELLFIDLMNESMKYIDRISDFTYFGDTLLNRYRLNALQSFKHRLKSKFNFNNAVPMHFSQPSSEKFLMETNLYLRNIFENYAKNNKLYKVVLDQAISPVNFKKTLRYFDNAKMIIVDRDPRDIYVTMINEKRLLGSDVLNKNSVAKYVKWHHAVRKQTAQDIDDAFMQDKVLRLNFEDFFIHYEETIEQIKEFLEIDYSHKYKGTKFKRDNINHHVGIWKHTTEQDAMSHIKEELGEYCFIN